MSETVEGKPWWQSKTKIGILASTVATVAGLFGVALDAATLTEVAFGVIVLASNLYASFGRDKADTPIDTKQVLPGLRLR